MVRWAARPACSMPMPSAFPPGACHAVSVSWTHRMMVVASTQ
jgi:hypothetical protein